jgi:hypothetical protein
MPRNLDAILVAEAEKLIDPPEDSVEMFRAQVRTCIETTRKVHQTTMNIPAPGEMRDLAAAYLEKLLAVKKAADTVKSFHRSSDFFAALDQEIIQMDALTCLDVPSGGPKRNVAAHVAAIMARSLIDPDPNHIPENRGKDWPVIECPWRRPAKLTRGGAWLKLAALIYKGATGKSLCDMMEHCRQIDEQKPSHVVRLRPSGSPRSSV